MTSSHKSDVRPASGRRAPAAQRARTRPDGVTPFDEVVIATFISGPHAVTLPKRMWDGILYRADPAIAAISTMLIGLTVSILVVAAGIRRRRDPGGENRA